MPRPPGPQYTTDHSVNPDGTVDFACSVDLRQWPWLALPSQHPIVLQTQNFWASIGAMDALDKLDEGKWSALTWSRWECGPRDCGIAVRGRYENTLVDDRPAFSVMLLDAQDRIIAGMLGKGVVFRNRNFEHWRATAKGESEQTAAPGDFRYASRSMLNLSEYEVPFVSALANGHAKALITVANGLPPAHPYLSGSGDHVNATHLAEVARQVASLALDGAPFRIVGGEMDMRRYVELGCPFRIDVKTNDGNSIGMSLSQTDRDCATISLQVETL